MVRRLCVVVATALVSLVVFGAGSIWVNGSTVGFPLLEDCVIYERDTASGDLVGRVEFRIPRCDAMADVYVADNGVALRLEDPPTKDQVAHMNPASSAHRFRVPSLGVDVALKEMNTYTEDGQRVINPPTMEDAYVVRDWAQVDDAPQGMMVLAMHSARPLPTIAGSRLIDVDSGTSRVKVGEKIEVDSLVYEVTGVSVQDKKTVPQSGVWKDEPGKLLVFTCLQRPVGKSVNNVIIEARLKN